MSIQKISFTPGPGLRKELEFFTATDQGQKVYSEIKGVDGLISLIETNPDYVDLKILVKGLPQGRLLDVGVGWGLTSAYLGVKGYEVTCLEPSPEACHSMEQFFSRLDLQQKIYCGPAEALDHIQGNFDYVVFWSSFHHCDDPLLVIHNAYQILRPGGWVILFEPVLRFYRSKRWFYRMMEKNPGKIGHYGGNEHTYRYQEYLDFLTEAGFNNISSRPSEKYVLIPKRAPWDNGARWIIKNLYYRLTRRVTENPNPISRLLIRLSLLLPLIIGQKRVR
jgi:SAM-dependent methyltransferase